MKKTNIVLAIIGCISLIGCKGNTWSEPISEISKSSEPTRIPEFRFEEEEAYVFMGCNYHYHFKLINGVGPVSVKSTNPNVATGNVIKDYVDVIGVNAGTCDFIVKADNYEDVTYTLPVHIGPDYLHGGHIIDPPIFIHIAEEIELDFATEPAFHRADSRVIYTSEDKSIANVEFDRLVGHGLGTTYIRAHIELINEEGYHGPEHVDTGFTIAVIE